jgi:hypothetical protein
VSAAPYKLQHTARGARPQFSENPEVDRVLAITMALASEVAALRERFDTFETLSARQGGVTPAEVEAFVAAPEQEKAREQWRHDFLDRILYIVRAETDHTVQRAGTAPP